MSDSPCQGKGLKVNSQVYNLMSSKPSDSRSVPLSVREATVLETTLRSTMESYNFQLWTMTALFRFLGESGHFNLDDPLLDQFQRSFSRGTENVAAGMASAVAFVTTKRRESFLSHMVGYRLSRRPRSANCCRILSSNRRIFLRLPPSMRLVTLQEMSPCIREPSLGLLRRLGRLSGGLSLRLLRPEVVLTHLLSLHRNALQHHLLLSVFRPEEVVRSPEETWGFSEVGVCPLAQHRRLSGPFLASMGGSGSGCLGRGGLARGIQDPFLPPTSFVRPTPPHAILYPVFHQGKSLGAGVPRSPPQTSHRTGSSDSRLLQSPICGPEGFRGVAPHHRPVYPEHLHRFPAISYGDSSVCPPFHSPRRLDDLLRSTGHIPPSSDPSGIASVSSLHYGRSLLSVQGAMLRADNCPSGLYTADGSNIRHSPSLRYQDAQISRRLVDSRRIQDRLYPGEGQAPSSVRGAGITSQFQEVVLDPISGHDLSRHADPVGSVRCNTDREKGRKSPQDHRGVSFIPGSPSSSLASSSGPPFVPYSSGEGWDVKDAISPDSPRVQVGLPRRIASHPLGSSVSGGSFMVVLGDSTTRGRRPFPPRLELLLGRIRRRLGRHRGGKPSVRSLDSKPKGTLHQPQGNDGSAERPLRVQLSSQRQDDRSLLRQCHDSRLPQAIGRHEVSGPVPQGEGDSPVGRIHGDHATSPVYPGVSQLESGSSQSAQPGDRVGMDATPGGSPRSSPPVAGDHRPVRDLAGSKAPSVLCSSVGTQSSGGRCIPPALGQPSGVCLSSHSHHKESSSQTESLSQLRSDSNRPLLASKRMVSRSAGTSIRHSNRTTQTSRSAATTAFPSVSRKSSYASSDCVATQAIRQSAGLL